MFTNHELERYAKVLLWGLKTARGKPFRRNDVVRIAFDLEGLGLAEACYRLCIKEGLRPFARISQTASMELDMYRFGCKDQWGFIPEGTGELNHSLNGSIFILAPSSLTHLRDIDPTRIGVAMRAAKPFRDILNRREEKGLFGWTLCSMPTRALAEKAGMGPKAYAEEIRKGCYLDKADPIGEWKRIFRAAMEIKKELNGMKVKHLRVESPSFDLKVTPGERRRWMGVSGHNIPSFEIFTSPDWRGTEGGYFSNLPTYRSGNLVKGVRILFRAGKAVKVTADTGEAFTRKMLATDPDACKIGEFSLTDKRFSRINRFMAETLYDENFGGRYGNCHVALGSSYSDTFAGDPALLTKAKKRTLGFNDSALHWDLVNTEKKTVTAVLANGKNRVIYENGQFTL